MNYTAIPDMLITFGSIGVLIGLVANEAITALVWLAKGDLLRRSRMFGGQ
jgi:hypothetical protein